MCPPRKRFKLEIFSWTSIQVHFESKRLCTSPSTPPSSRFHASVSLRIVPSSHSNFKWVYSLSSTSNATLHPIQSSTRAFNPPTPSPSYPIGNREAKSSSPPPTCHFFQLHSLFIVTISSPDLGASVGFQTIPINFCSALRREEVQIFVVLFISNGSAFVLIEMLFLKCSDHLVNNLFKVVTIARCIGIF